MSSSTLRDELERIWKEATGNCGEDYRCPNLESNPVALEAMPQSQPDISLQCWPEPAQMSAAVGADRSEAAVPREAVRHTPGDKRTRLIVLDALERPRRCPRRAFSCRWSNGAEAFWRSWQCRSCCARWRRDGACHCFSQPVQPTELSRRRKGRARLLGRCRCNTELGATAERHKYWDPLEHLPAMRHQSPGLSRCQGAKPTFIAVRELQDC
jgi:hypothetical protein